MPRQCSLGCSNKNVNHQFPHPEKNPDRFKAWVHIVGGKLDSPADYELYRKKVICDIHFTDRDRNRNNRLNFLAVPSLHLPGKSDDVGTLEKVLLAPEPVIEENSVATIKLEANPDDVCMSEKVILVPESKHEGCSLAVSESTLKDKSSRNSFSEHNYFQRQKKAINKNKSKSDDVGTLEKVLLAPEPVIEENSVATIKLEANPDDVCMSEKVILVPESKHEGCSLAVSESTLKDKSSRNSFSEHNYFQRQKKAINKNKSDQQQESLLLNQLKTTRRKMKILQSNLRRSQKRNKTLKSRLIMLEKCLKIFYYKS